jgi:hypothetical protein
MQPMDLQVNPQKRKIFDSFWQVKVVLEKFARQQKLAEN